MRSLFSAITILALSGCMSMGPSIPTPTEAMSAINSRFLGQPIGEALMVYGIPDGQTQIQGHKVFIWHRTNNITYSKPETITTRGAVGDPNQYPWASSVPYVQSSTYNQPDTVGYQCVLSIGTDTGGNIDGVAINGKMGACQVFVP